MKQSLVETGINRSILINCVVGKCPFPAPNGHYHERSINGFRVLSTFDTIPNALGDLKKVTALLPNLLDSI
jgi:hypothetical protein